MGFRGHDHETFVRAVYRRLVVVRAAEAVGVCVLAACAVALPIVLVQAIRGAATGGPLVALTALSLVAAVGVALHRWPSIRSAAVEADRQFDLSDLLATALALDGGDGRPAVDVMAAEVLALADARCRQLSPSDVVLNRLGARTWGGIGLSVALVVTCAVMPLRPTRSDAAAGDGARALALTGTVTMTDDPLQLPAARMSMAPRGVGDPTSDEGRRFSDGSNDAARGEGGDGRRPADAHGRDVAGGGAALRTTASIGAPNLRNESVNPGASVTSAKGTVAGGSGGLDTRGARGGDSLNGAGAASSIQSPAWVARNNAAAGPGDAAAPDGAPAAYRDLVRDYFGAK